MADTYTQNAKSITPAQVLVDLYDGTIPRRNPTATFNFCKARGMRLHPSIALGREFAIAPIVGAGWSVEGDDAQVEFITDELLHHRTALLRNCLLGEIDFGWKAFEIVYTLEGGLDRLKPLKNDTTWARRDAITDEFKGLKVIDQYGVNIGLPILISPIHSLFMSCDEEGLGGYGIAKLARVEAAYDDWIEAAAVAAKYDKKIAGGVWKVDYFPVKYDVDGVETDAHTIASDVLKAIRGAGSVAVPNQPQMIGDKTVSSFNIEHISADSAQADFISRLKYLDALMFRGLAIPERVLSEGSFGTKAESEAQASVALLNLQLKHEAITEAINKYVVTRLLELRFGKADAHLCALPLSDSKAAFFQDTFKSMLADPSVGPEIVAATDMTAICESVSWPLSDDEPLEIEPAPPQPVVVQAPPGQEQAPPQQGAAK